jgi:hypothetical protein
VEDPFMPQPTITCQFQALFTTFFGLLFSFCSRYYCAIGFEDYLVLEIDDPQIPARIPTRGTQDTARPLNASAYGTVTLYGTVFQKTSASHSAALRRAYHTTSPLRDSV